MSDGIKPTQSPVSWEAIKETALQNDQLEADIRVGGDAILIEPSGVSKIWQNAKVHIGYEVAPSYPTREETLERLKTNLRFYFRTNILQLIQETGIDKKNPERCRFLIVNSETELDKITAALDINFSLSSMPTSQAIQQAHDAAQSSLIALRQEFSASTIDKTPQIIKTSDGKFCVIRPAALPENMVLAGGGVKGVGYVGAYHALEKSGTLHNLQRVAGSSAGAMSAAMIAAGLNAAEFQQASNDTSFWDVMVKSSKDMAVYATKLAGGWGFSGGYAEDKINKAITTSVKNFLNNNKANDSKLDANGKKVIENLKAALNPKLGFWGNIFFFLRSEKTVPITFGHLAILRKMDPTKFKELTITGFDKTDQKEKYFSTQDKAFWNMPIVNAVRISMALPGVYEEIKFGHDLYVDGGIGSNEPTEAFSKEPHEKTLVLGFDNQGKFNQVVYEGKTEVTSTWSEYFHALLSGNKHLEASQTADNEKLYDAGPNALDVYHGDLDTMSFLASDQRMKAAQRQAEVRMYEQLALRQNQAVTEVYDTLEAALESMSGKELEAVIEKYPDTELSRIAQEKIISDTWRDVDPD